MVEHQCSKCGGSGLFPATGNICKACTAKRKAEWYQRNKAQRNKKNAAYRQQHPKSYDPEYYQQHKEPVRKAVRKWQERNPDKVGGYDADNQRNRRKKYPAKYHAIDARRNAKRKGSHGKESQ